MAPVIVIGLWVVSCLGNLLFYRVLHPWGEVNGPKEKSCRTLFCSCLDRKTDDRIPSSDVEMNEITKLN